MPTTQPCYRKKLHKPRATSHAPTALHPIRSQLPQPPAPSPQPPGSIPTCITQNHPRSSHKRPKRAVHAANAPRPSVLNSPTTYAHTPPRTKHHTHRNAPVPQLPLRNLSEAPQPNASHTPRPRARAFKWAVTSPCFDSCRASNTSGLSNGQSRYLPLPAAGP